MTTPEPPIRSKPWYRSTTIWLNIAAFLMLLVPVISEQLGSVIGAELALRVTAAIALLASIVNIAVRAFITSTAIKPGTAG